MSDETTNNDSVNELNLEYNRKIHVFHSFEEQEIHNLKITAAQNPIERVKNTVQLILRMYQMNPIKKNPKNEYKIFIDRE